MIFAQLFIIGFIASFINGMAGGGGAILSIPFLIFLGLPPQIAIATNRFGALGMGASSIYEFFKDKKIVFKYLFPLIVLSIVGSLIGANLLVNINEETLNRSVGLLILIILPIILLRSDAGTESRVVSKKSKIAAYIGYFFVAVYDGFFGAASGLMGIFILTSFLGMTYIEANATDKVAWILNAIISVIIFASFNLINYRFGIVLMAGMLIGGYLGAFTAVKKGNHFIRISFFLVVLFSAIKLLLLD